MTLDEFDAHVDRSGGPMACWPWTGTVGSHGYGTAWIDGRTQNAHVVAYTLAHGPVTAGLVVRHLCVDRSTRRISGGPLAERRCCNPAHLLAGSHRQNAIDRSRHGRSSRSR